MTIRVEIDADRCEATGFCTQVAPEIFQLEAGPPVKAPEGPIAADDEEDCREAAEMCPTRAIRLLRRIVSEGG